MDLHHRRSQNANGFQGIAHAVQNHVGGIKVHAHVGVIQFAQHTGQSRGRLLTGLEAKLHPLVGKNIGHVTQSPEQLGPLWIISIMRQEARVERDQLQIVVPRQRGHRVGVFQVGVPVFVGTKASGLGDRFE